MLGKWAIVAFCSPETPANEDPLVGAESPPFRSFPGLSALGVQPAPFASCSPLGLCGPPREETADPQGTALHSGLAWRAEASGRSSSVHEGCLGPPAPCGLREVREEAAPPSDRKSIFHADPRPLGPRPPPGPPRQGQGWGRCLGLLFSAGPGEGRGCRPRGAQFLELLVFSCGTWKSSKGRGGREGCVCPAGCAGGGGRQPGSLG